MKRINLNTEDLFGAKESSTTVKFTGDDTYSSSFFSTKKNFLSNLLSTESPEATAVLEPGLEQFTEGKAEERIRTAETIAVHGWKNIENISARLVECYDNVVVLECLVDKELGIYEEREFRCSLFTGYDLAQGSLFYLRFFERAHETRLEIHDDPQRSFENDFPKIQLKPIFEASKLFKKT